MSLNKEQILALGAGHTLNKPQLLHILGGNNDNMLSACPVAVDYIDKHPDSNHDLALVWRDCPRADWWRWLISDIISLAQPDAYLHINKAGYWLHLRDFNKMFDKFDGEWEQRKIDYHLTLDEREIGTKEYYEQHREQRREQHRVFCFNNRHLLADACRPHLPDWDTIIVPGLLSVFRFRSMLWKEHRNASKEI